MDVDPDIDPEILAHYAESNEDERLTRRSGLELLRTRILLRRWLPEPPARVLDVGGASGVHAVWLAELGHRAHLVDPVPLHVEQAARHGTITAALGDARQLDEADASWDAVLLLGPLYHLVARDDRVRALREAARVVRPGGPIVVAAISRYVSAYDGILRGFADRPGIAAVVRDDVRTGLHRNPTGDPDMFTTAYFHDVAGLTAEIADAGLRLERLVAVEGPFHWASDIAERLADPDQRALVLDVLDAMEDDPSVTGATAHVLALARRS